MMLIIYITNLIGYDNLKKKKKEAEYIDMVYYYLLLLIFPLILTLPVVLGYHALAKICLVIFFIHTYKYLYI